jgi:hypothetical protein
MSKTRLTLSEEEYDVIKQMRAEKESKGMHEVLYVTENLYCVPCEQDFKNVLKHFDEYFDDTYDVFLTLDDIQKCLENLIRVKKGEKFIFESYRNDDGDFTYRYASKNPNAPMRFNEEDMKKYSKYFTDVKPTKNNVKK